MIHIHENMGDTLDFAESLGWVDDDGPDSDLIEESALDFIQARGYVICQPEPAAITPPERLAQMVRSRYSGGNTWALCAVIDSMESNGEVKTPASDENIETFTDDYWDAFWSDGRINR